MKIFSRTEIDSHRVSRHSSLDWTLLIAAAGKGTRLGADLPKVLYPIKGIPILTRILRTFDGICQKKLLITSNASYAKINSSLEGIGGAVELIKIDHTDGMADTVHQGMINVSSKYTIVIWGDQPAISRQTALCMVNVVNQGFKCCVPLVKKINPYIAFNISSSGKLEKVLHLREGDTLPKIGIGDCGVFAFESDYLLRSLSHTKGMHGKLTGEWNFLPILELVDSLSGIGSFYVKNKIESIGLNTMDDLKKLESVIDD